MFQGHEKVFVSFTCLGKLKSSFTSTQLKLVFALDYIRNKKSQQKAQHCYTL